MASTDITDSVEILLGNVIELRGAADTAQLPVVRGVAENVALNEDFDLDAVSDIKMAVDEVAAQLISRAVLGGVLTCRYWLMSGELRVSMSVQTPDGTLPDQRSFGWFVLSALTDRISARAGDADGRHNQVYIDFVKRKGSHVT
ncbi:hypothetical protein [Amycolatopsis anabasis]|uniref:hypothetical protein n=1 Tax=Amycolatopsis anabasis TaxID=1840409 RepID=UPI00131EA706|nr:hypothetical protein [Amycolatopsis anabasis]